MRFTFMKKETVLRLMQVLQADTGIPRLNLTENGGMMSITKATSET